MQPTTCRCFSFPHCFLSVRTSFALCKHASAVRSCSGANNFAAPYAVWPAQHHSLAHPIHKECILDVSITANVTLKVGYIHKEFILDISITDFGALAGQGAARLSLAHPTHKEFIDDSITANITRIEVGYLHKELILDGITTAIVSWMMRRPARPAPLAHPEVPRIPVMSPPASPLPCPSPASCMVFRGLPLARRHAWGAH